MTIGVVIFTYNRPRMLTEALASVRRNRPDRIIICDDGSEPPVEAPEDVTVIRAPRRTPEERLNKNLSGYLGNAARNMIGTDYIAWLCDDDLMADGWLDYVRQAPLAPLYIGGVEFFEDPVHGTINWKNFEHSPSEMTTGNWVERTDLPIQWQPYVWSADAAYVWELLKQCSQRNVYKVPADDPWENVERELIERMGPARTFLHDRLALHYRNHNLTLGNLLTSGRRDEQFKKGTME